jgi:hypothetical protein
MPDYQKLIFEVEAVIGKAEAKLGVIEAELEAIERDRTAKVDIEVTGEGGAALAAAVDDLTSSTDKAALAADRLKGQFADTVAELRSAGWNDQADQLEAYAHRLDEVDHGAAGLRNRMSTLAGQLTKMGMKGLANEIVALKPPTDNASDALGQLGAEMVKVNPDIAKYDLLRSKLVGLRGMALDNGMKHFADDLMKVAPGLDNVSERTLVLRNHMKGLKSDALALGMKKEAKLLDDMMPRLDGTSGFIAKLKNGFDSFGEGIKAAIPALGSMVGMFSLLVVGGGMLLGVIVALGAALVAFMAALAPLAGLLAVIPAGIALLAQTLGVAFLALSRVKGALDAQKKAQDAASASTTKGKDAAHAAKVAAHAYAEALYAQEQAAEAVTRANEKLTEATQRYNDVMSGSALDVMSAQQSQKESIEDLAEATTNYSEVVQGIKRDEAIQQASFDARQAQLSLLSSTEALWEAQERLRKLLNPDPTDIGEAEVALMKAQEELRKEIAYGTGSLVDLREAENNVAKAQEKLNKLQGKGADFEHDLAQARIDVDQATLNQEEAVVSATKSAEDLLEIQTTSLENTKEYRDATNELQRAIINVGESQKSLTDIEKGAKEGLEAATRAQESASHTAEQSHWRVQEAAYNMAHATDAATTAQREFKDEMAKLSQPAQNLVSFLGTMKGKLGELQTVAEKGMLPGVLEGLKSAQPFFDAIKQVVSDTAPVLGGFVRDFGKFMGSPIFTDAFRTIGENNATILGILLKALEPLTVAFQNIMIAAQPLMVFLAQGFLNWAESFRKWSEDGEGLNNFFKEVIVTVDKVMTIIGNLFSGMGGLFAGGKEEGVGLLDTLVRISGVFADWANSPEGQEALKRFFSDVIPTAKEFLKTVGLIIIDLIKLVSDPKFQETIRGVIEAIKTIIEWAGKIVTAFAWLPGFIQKAAIIGGIIAMILGKLGLLGPAVTIIKVVFMAALTALAGFLGLPVLATAALVAAVLAAIAITWHFRDEIWRAIKSVASVIWGVAQDIWDAICWPFEKFWDWAFGESFFPDLLHALVTWFAELPGKILGAIGDVLGTLFNIGWDILNGLWNGIVEMWDWIAENFKPWDWITGLFGAIADVAKWLFNHGKAILIGLWNGMVDWFTTLWENIWGLVKSLWGIFGGAGTWLLTAGKNILIGLWNGIAGLTGWFWEELSGFLGDIWDGITGFFGFGSPSKLMMGAGQDIMKGLAIGIHNQAGSAVNEAMRAAHGVAGALGGMDVSLTGTGTAPSPRAGAAPGTTVVHQYVNVEGSVVRERELADKMRRLQIQTGKRNATAYGRYG